MSHLFTTPPPFNANNARRPPMENRPLPDFHMSHIELFKQLCRDSLLGPCPGKTFMPPYPRWYNPNHTCDYHSNSPGHSIEDCYGFRNAVWRLIDNGAIKLKEESKPHIRNNPFPNHSEGQVNSICYEKHESQGVENDQLSMKEILEILSKAGYEMEVEGDKGKRTVKGEENDLFCECSEMKHHIEECPQLKLYIEKMIKLGVLEVPKGSRQSINMIHHAPPVYKVYNYEPTLIFKVPKPFSYESNHAVPWRYETVIESNSVMSGMTSPSPKQVHVFKVSSLPSRPAVTAKSEYGNEDCSKPSASESITNVTGIGGITRSGRCYTPEKFLKSPQATPVKNAQVSPVKENKEKSREEEEEEEFLKIMKQSEYDVVEQLKKTQAKISLYSLILSSEAHRNAIKKVLDQAYVSKDITPDRVEGIVNAIRMTNAITFTESEVFPHPTRRPKALHITLKCQGCNVAKVLIDGGSAFNVLPYSTLQQLPVDSSVIEPSGTIVKAFDGSMREIMGAIDLPLEIGPTIFVTKFQVMDIEPGYTMLLGRPWIHEAGAVPSTLHQRVKFIDGGKLVTIKGEEELLVTKPVTVPYIDCAEDTLEVSFQNLEIAEPMESKGDTHQVAIHIMRKSGFEEGKGLGSQLQGIKNPISLPDNPGKLGLGYEATSDQQSFETSKKKIPHIRDTFPAPATVMVIEADETVSTLEGISRLIYPSLEPVNNWESAPLNDLFFIE